MSDKHTRKAEMEERKIKLSHRMKKILKRDADDFRVLDSGDNFSTSTTSLDNPCLVSSASCSHGVGTLQNSQGVAIPPKQDTTFEDLLPIIIAGTG